MEKKSIKFFDIVLRYFVIILLSLFGISLFYLVFAPLTSYPVYFLFSMIFEKVSFSNELLPLITINNKLPIMLIPACVAGSAYFLLVMLNLSTPNLKLKRRIYSLAFLIGAFLLINILRIFIFGILAYFDFSFFDLAHQFFWYFLSVFFVVGIWFAEIKIFKIKEIPFYSDAKFLFEKSIFRGKIKR